MKKKMGDEEFTLVDNVGYVLRSELRVSILTKVSLEKIIKKAVLESLLTDKHYPLFQSNTIRLYVYDMIKKGLLEYSGKKTKARPIITLSAEGEKVLRKIKKMRKEW